MVLVLLDGFVGIYLDFGERLVLSVPRGSHRRTIPKYKVSKAEALRQWLRRVFGHWLMLGGRYHPGDLLCYHTYSSHTIDYC